jgi:hypothetical protein
MERVIRLLDVKASVPAVGPTDPAGRHERQS